MFRIGVYRIKSNTQNWSKQDLVECLELEYTGLSRMLRIGVCRIQSNAQNWSIHDLVESLELEYT